MNKLSVHKKTFVFCCLWIVFIAGAANLFHGAAAAAPSLKTSISEDAGLDPLPPTMAKGSLFSPKELQALFAGNTNQGWARVPSWLAGYWKKTEAKTYFNRNFQTGEKDTTEHVLTPDDHITVYGAQKDSGGTIWHYQPLGIVDRRDVGPAIYYSMQDGWQLDESTENLVTISSNVILVVVDKATGRIVSALRSSSYDTFTPLSEGKVKHDSIQRYFSNTGEPTSTMKAAFVRERTGPFAAIDLYGGTDLKKLFADFQRTRDPGKPISP